MSCQEVMEFNWDEERENDIFAIELLHKSTREIERW
jgi:hypothetical protein